MDVGGGDPSSIQESPFLMDCGEGCEESGSLDALLLEENGGTVGGVVENQATVSQGGSGEQ